MAFHSQDGNGNFGNQTLEDLSEYEHMIQMTFNSEEEGYEFFNSFAREKGFSVRKGKVRRSSNGGDITCRHFFCFKQGTRQPKFLKNMANKKRRPQALTRFRCPGELVIKYNPQMKLWYVHKYNDTHNHELARPNEVYFLFSHRKITEAKKTQILEYQTAGLRKYQIMDVMEQQYGGSHNVGHVCRDLYNFTHLNKKGKILDGDANTVLQYMRRRQLEDSEFFFQYQTNSEGRLLNLFWCDAQSRLYYQAFGDLVIFDSTYRTNRYNMPFVPFVGLNHHRSTVIFACAIISHESVESYVWLLHTLLIAMYQKEPRPIITDGDRAMRRAIRIVLPNACHRICSWHIERNATRYLHHSMISDFRKLIYMRGPPKSFMDKWKGFLKEHKIGKHHKCRTWLSKMFILRKMWAACFLKKKYFLGARSNQRSESLNSRLHKHLDRKMMLYDMVEHYFHCVSRIRRNESELDCIVSQSIPVATTEHQLLEFSATNYFTPANFYLVQKENERTAEYEIVEILDCDDSVKYMVAARGGSKVFSVVCDDEETLGDVRCSCLKFECKGLPCCHIMIVLIRLGAAIPQCCVLNRWTCNGKSSSIDEPDHVNSMKRARVAELVDLAKQVFEEASSDDFVRWKEILVSELNRKRKKNEMDGKCSHTQEEDDKLEEDEAPINVQDPVQVLSKGAPKKLKSFQDIKKVKRVRRCSECKGIDHDKRNCKNKR